MKGGLLFLIGVMAMIWAMATAGDFMIVEARKQYTLDSLRYELEIKEAVKSDSMLSKIDIIYRDFMPAK